MFFVFVFFFQAEDGIRDWSVTGVQTCALPISALPRDPVSSPRALERRPVRAARNSASGAPVPPHVRRVSRVPPPPRVRVGCEGVDLRAVQENRSAGVGRDVVMRDARCGMRAHRCTTHPASPISHPVYNTATRSPTDTIPEPTPVQ